MSVGGKAMSNQEPERIDPSRANLLVSLLYTLSTFAFLRPISFVARTKHVWGFAHFPVGFNRPAAGTPAWRFHHPTAWRGARR